MNIQGTILDNQNKPLPDASVYVEENGNFVFDTTTDTNGFFTTLKGGFSANDLPRLKITYIGYKDKIQPPAMGHLIIMEESTEEVEAVTVKGKKASVKPNYLVISLIIAIVIGFFIEKK